MTRRERILAAQKTNAVNTRPTTPVLAEEDVADLTLNSPGVTYETITRVDPAKEVNVRRSPNRSFATKVPMTGWLDFEHPHNRVEIVKGGVYVLTEGPDLGTLTVKVPGNTRRKGWACELLPSSTRRYDRTFFEAEEIDGDPIVKKYEVVNGIIEVECENMLGFDKRRVYLDVENGVLQAITHDRKAAIKGIDPARATPSPVVVDTSTPPVETTTPSTPPLASVNAKPTPRTGLLAAIDLPEPVAVALMEALAERHGYVVTKRTNGSTRPMVPVTHAEGPIVVSAKEQSAVNGRMAMLELD